MERGPGVPNWRRISTSSAGSGVPSLDSRDGCAQGHGGVRWSPTFSRSCHFSKSGSITIRYLRYAVGDENKSSSSLLRLKQATNVMRSVTRASIDFTATATTEMLPWELDQLVSKYWDNLVGCPGLTRSGPRCGAASARRSAARRSPRPPTRPGGPATSWRATASNARPSAGPAPFEFEATSGVYTELQRGSYMS
jgi:hypothetical protein